MISPGVNIRLPYNLYLKGVRNFLAHKTISLIQQLRFIIMSQAPPAREGIHPIFQLQNASPNRLIHLVPDQLAEEVPDHPLFSYPQTADPQDGFVDVSSKCFANAINRTSWFLLAHLGPPAPFESIGYMGPSKLLLLSYFEAIEVWY